MWQSFDKYHYIYIRIRYRFTRIHFCADVVGLAQDSGQFIGKKSFVDSEDFPYIFSYKNQCGIVLDKVRSVDSLPPDGVSFLLLAYNFLLDKPRSAFHVQV